MKHLFRVSNQLPVRLADQGISLPELLRVAGLPPDYFQQEKIQATTSQLFALYRAIGELSGDPAIGLKLGSEPRMERYHPPAVVMVCSRTYRDAIQRMARYKQLTSPEEIHIKVQGDEAAVDFVFTDAKEVHPEIVVDLVLAWIYGVGQRGTEGRIKPLRVELTRCVKHRTMLEEHFGCRVRFNAGRNALVFRNRDLDTPFITHNQELLEAIGAKLEHELAERRGQDDVPGRVKLALKRSLAGQRASLPDIARDLGMGTRTLQRKLVESGTTFKQVVEETRRELAHHYLSQSNVELTGVAFLLGYQDANSFYRAFQSWEGTTPGEWRARNQASVMTTS